MNLQYYFFDVEERDVVLPFPSGNIITHKHIDDYKAIVSTINGKEQVRFSNSKN
ncbi:MAG: hypothetical protein JXR20_04635 [Balneola sp.]